MARRRGRGKSEGKGLGKTGCGEEEGKREEIASIRERRKMT